MKYILEGLKGLIERYRKGAIFRSKCNSVEQDKKQACTTDRAILTTDQVRTTEGKNFQLIE